MHTFKNATIVTGETVLPKGSFSVHNGKFVRICSGLSDEGEDLDGCYVIPGFIDTHIHGFSRYNFEDAHCDYAAAGTELKKKGITSYFAAICPFDKDGNYHSGWLFPEHGIFKGVHLEGPFINVEQRGGFYKKQIQPYSEEMFAKLIQDLQGQVKVMTAAPEVTEWKSLCRLAQREKIVLSAGHTKCDALLARQIFQAGVKQITHIFNAMPGLHHREPGILCEVLLNPEVYCEAICDLYHVSPEVIKILWKLKGPERIIAVSDSVFVEAGMEVREGLVYNGDTVYGSQSDLYRMFRNLILNVGISILDAVKMTSSNAGNHFGLQTGRICQGMAADFIVMDRQLNIQSVFTAADFPD